MASERHHFSSPTQRGVVYFNSVPRDMRPQEVRLHFNTFGEIRRMRFIPFPKKARRQGGPLLPLQFKEGWMEFAKAADAETAAMMMNGKPVNVKRQRRCYGQLWTAKFVEDYTWDSLLEEQEGRRRDRRAAEVDAHREERSLNEAYRRLVLKSHQQRRRSAPRRPEEESSDGQCIEDTSPSSSPSSTVAASQKHRRAAKDAETDATRRRSCTEDLTQPKKRPRTATAETPTERSATKTVRVEQKKAKLKSSKD